MTMEEGLINMEKQTSSSNYTTSSSSSSLSMHKNSQTISKAKPKIRIIHIFAPEIIKTDAANFRELVQRLTGKPRDGDQGKRKSRKREQGVFTPSKKMEVAMMRAGFHAEELRERIKGEEEIWRGANSGGGFLGGFAEFDGLFMQEINQFPFMEGTTTAQINDAYGEPQLV